MGTSSHFLSAFTIFVKFFATQKSHGHYHFRHRILLRRHFGRSHPRPDAPLERNRLAGRAPKIRRRDPGTSIPGPPAKYRPGSRYGPERGRRDDRQDRRDRFHARPRSAGIASGGRIVRQRTLDLPRHSAGGGQSSAGAHPLPLSGPARPTASAPRLSVPLPAGQRRTYPNRKSGRSARHADRRHDDRRRRRAKRSTSAPKSWGCPIRAGR